MAGARAVSYTHLDVYKRQSHSLSTLINYLYFQNQNAGYSAAVGMFMFLFIMVISTFVRNFFERKVAGLS